MPIDHTAPRTTTDSPIARRRIAAGLTQTQLAERLGVTQLTVSRWENEGRIPRRPMLYKLAEMLACEPRDLLSRHFSAQAKSQAVSGWLLCL